MNTIVVDSSVILKWLNRSNEESLRQADLVVQDAIDLKTEIVVPELAKYEIGNALMKKRLAIQEANVSFATFYSLPLTFVSESEDMALQTYSLACNLGITYYDASFLSLAKQYNAVLVTENVKHQGKTNKVKVIPLKNYA